MRINEIHIRNFKSLYDTKFEPGNVNVLIGANGSGKSSVLEALGILSAAMSDRVNDNSLQRMGVRLSPSPMYKSRFKTIDRIPAAIEFQIEWADTDKDGAQVKCLYKADMLPPTSGDSWGYLSEAAYQDGERVTGRSNRTKAPIPNDVGYFMLSEDMQDKQCRMMGEYLSDFGIYQPETAVLRGNITDPTQRTPVGLTGGRLAEAVQSLFHQEDGDLMLGDLYEDDFLELIDWAQEFRVTTPKKSTLNSAVSSTRQVIEFKDKYLKQNAYFTGYDASEGALYVLFMLTLAMHRESPVVFSVDNFDQALNPRLARRLTRLFSEEVISHGKTVFLTTHNPLVLDGLDLADERNRLFSVNRNADGYTELQRISVTGDLLKKNMPLSRLWAEGYIGGVPELL